MRVTSLLFLLLFLLPPTSEAAELGWMKVDGDGTPTPADHQVRTVRSSSRRRSKMFDV